MLAAPHAAVVPVSSSGYMQLYYVHGSTVTRHIKCLIVASHYDQLSMKVLMSLLLFCRYVKDQYTLHRTQVRAPLLKTALLLTYICIFGRLPPTQCHHATFQPCYLLILVCLRAVHHCCFAPCPVCRCCAVAVLLFRLLHTSRSSCMSSWWMRCLSTGRSSW
jgi:hypothetical protein